MIVMGTPPQWSAEVVAMEDETMWSSLFDDLKKRSELFYDTLGTYVPIGMGICSDQWGRWQAGMGFDSKVPVANH